jgi:iron only hydrogenase large subunit-like protein
LKNKGPFPMYSSCCPSWVKYAEHTSNEITGSLSSVKSSQQLTGVIVKTHIAALEKINIENLHVVSIVPCTSKKYEATRPEMSSDGISDVDAVITTRELLRMIKMYGIDVANIEPDPIKNYFNSLSTTGKLINVSGGTAEAIARSIYSFIVGKEMPEYKINSLRGNKAIKETRIKMGDYELGFAVVNGLGNAKQLLAEIESGRNDLHYIEVMACPGGCIAGGGQPIGQKEDNVKQRQKTIYESDEKDIIKAAHLNTQLLELYGKNFGHNVNHCVAFKKKEVCI